MNSNESKDQKPVKACLLIAALSVCLVLLAWHAGWMELLELKIYDLMVRTKTSTAARDDRIVLITISDDDIYWLNKEKGCPWPMTDQVLSQVLSNLLDLGPKVVGLDIYRDLEIPPGTSELTTLLKKTFGRIVTIRKLGNEKIPGVRPPPVVPNTNLTGFNDKIVDPDGIVRRALLFMDDPEEGSIRSCELLMAMLYMRDQGIKLVASEENPDHFRFGKAIFKPLEASDGGYVKADSRGYQILLDYGTGGPNFESRTLTELLSGKVDEAFVAGKCVLIGAAADSLKDFFYTPFSVGTTSGSFYTGVSIMAATVSQFLRNAIGEGTTFKFLPDYWEAAWILAWALGGALLATWLGSSHLLVPATLILAGACCATGYEAFSNGLWLPMGAPVVAMGLSAFGVVLNTSKQQQEHKSQLMQLFSRHVSEDVAEELWRQRDLFTSGGRPKPKRLTATILFSDLASFTAISESMSPEELMDWLNSYMDAMAKIIEARKGMIDKFIGDAIMAPFGVPVERTTPAEIADDALNAILCASEMSARIETLNSEFAARGLPGLRVRIGINTGSVIAGTLGSSRRMEYTVLGDAVNTASRLESLKLDSTRSRAQVSPEGNTSPPSSAKGPQIDGAPILDDNWTTRILVSEITMKSLLDHPGCRSGALCLDQPGSTKGPAQAGGFSWFDRVTALLESKGCKAVSIGDFHFKGKEAATKVFRICNDQTMV